MLDELLQLGQAGMSAVADSVSNHFTFGWKYKRSWYFSIKSDEFLTFPLAEIQTDNTVQLSLEEHGAERYVEN